MEELKKGKLPETSADVARLFKGNQKRLTHPAWPEQAGYVYVAGMPDPNAGGILVFENVPERKPNTPIQAIDDKGRISVHQRSELLTLLAEQERGWKRFDRRLEQIEMRAEP